jgi:hypothetical protein
MKNEILSINLRLTARRHNTFIHFRPLCHAFEVHWLCRRFLLSVEIDFDHSLLLSNNIRIHVMLSQPTPPLDVTSEAKFSWSKSPTIYLMSICMFSFSYFWIYSYTHETASSLLFFSQMPSQPIKMKSMSFSSSNS